MPGKEFLDVLVKLASLGTSGICIFAIFWIGWLIWHPPANPDPERHRTLRFFMAVCVIIALISLVTGLKSAEFNADAIRTLETKNRKQTDELKLITEKMSRYEAGLLQNQEVAESLSEVLKQKEVAALESNAPLEIRRHIKMLKSSIARLRGATN